MTEFHIYWQNQHGIWQKFLTKTNEADTLEQKRWSEKDLRKKIFQGEASNQIIWV